jgi:hypothetical protein
MEHQTYKGSHRTEAKHRGGLVQFALLGNTLIILDDIRLWNMLEESGGQSNDPNWTLHPLVTGPVPVLSIGFRE